METLFITIPIHRHLFYFCGLSSAYKNAKKKKNRREKKLHKIFLSKKWMRHSFRYTEAVDFKILRPAKTGSILLRLFLTGVFFLRSQAAIPREWQHTAKRVQTLRVFVSIHTLTYQPHSVCCVFIKLITKCCALFVLLFRCKPFFRTQ